MHQARHRLLLGSYDWDHPGWVPGFYPEDLPADWRLSYYANEHRVVLVPATRLQDTTAIAQWAQDVDEGFRFVFEFDQVPAGVAGPDVVPASAAAAVTEAVGRARDLLHAIAPLAAHCTGILVRAAMPADSVAVADTVTGALACLDGVLSTLGAQYPLSVDAGLVVNGTDACGVGAALSDLLARHDAGLCWHGPPAPSCLGRGRLALTLLDAPVSDLRRLRTIVEAGLAASEPARESVLIVAGSPPDHQTLAHAETLRDLL